MTLRARGTLRALRALFGSCFGLPIARGSRTVNYGTGAPESGIRAMTLVVGVEVLELHIPHSRSLKQKRRVVKSLIERVRHKYRVSIREIDFHDKHQRSKIALAMVGTSETETEQVLFRIRELVEGDPESMLLDATVDLLSEFT